MTWSIESVLRNLERITRPPRRGADGEDGEPVGDGGEQLAEREAAEEVSEPAECPTGYYVGDDEWYCLGCNGYFDNEAAFARHTADDADDTPNPTEPSLSDDELVAVRQLIEERFNPHVPAVGGYVIGGTPLLAAELFPQHTKSSAWSAGYAEPNAPADFPAAGSGGEAGSGVGPTSPRRTYLLGPDERDAVWRHGDARLYRWQHNSWMWRSPAELNWRWTTTGCSDVPSLDGVPFTEVVDDSDDAVAEWIGNAVPAISDVLSRHRWIIGECSCPTTGQRMTHMSWRDHIAALIANALAPQPK